MEPAHSGNGCARVSQKSFSKDPGALQMSIRNTTRPLSIWVMGDPVPEVQRRRGSFADIVREVVGDAWDGPWEEVDCVHGAERLPEAEQCAGVVMTGSPARIADQTPWMVRAQDSARSLIAAKVPVFGICFGHQLLGMALGGRSGPNPAGREIGTAYLRLEGEDSLLGPLPRSFPVSMTHLDSVLELPPGARALGSTERERYAAVRFAETAWGVQFHPELGPDSIGDYILSRREALIEEGLDPDVLLETRQETPDSAELLRRFARYAKAASVQR